MTDKTVIQYPSWHDNARALRKEGRAHSDIADYFGTTAGRMSQIATDNWRAYLIMFRGASQPDRRAGKKLAEFSNDADKYEFVAVQEPTPLERERARNIKKRNETPAVKEELPLAKEREFEAARKVVEGKHLIGAKIKCSKCNTTAEYFNNSGSVTPNHLPKEFTRMGWFVGKNERTDLCPEHAAPIRTPRPVEAPSTDAVVFTQKDKTMTAAAPSLTPKITTTSAWPKAEALPRIPVTSLPSHLSPAPAPAPYEAPKIMAPVAPASPVAPAPTPVAVASELGRTERRIIFAKLNDVYTDETKGYSGDWNDAKVAADLGVSVDWVSQVRDADFGPETNETIRSVQQSELLKIKDNIELLIVLIDKKIEQAQALDTKVKEALTAMDAAIDRAEQLKENIGTEDKKMEDLLGRFDTQVDEFKKKFVQLGRSSS